MGSSRRRARIAAWLETELPAWFEDRVLPVDADVADEWGRLLARLKTPVPAIDSLIAATALRHRFTIVTRNESDFTAAGADLLKPMEGLRLAPRRMMSGWKAAKFEGDSVHSKRLHRNSGLV